MPLAGPFEKLFADLGVTGGPPRWVYRDATGGDITYTLHDTASEAEVWAQGWNDGVMRCNRADLLIVTVVGADGSVMLIDRGA